MAGVGLSATDAPRVAVWRDVRILRGALQVGFVVGVVALGVWLVSNLTTNLDRLGIRSDFEFLGAPAGFRILGSDFEASGTIREALIVGITNSIRVAVIGMILALLLGIVVGVARLSQNWLIARVASGFVELLRNVPPLVLVIVFYQVTLEVLPRIQDAAVSNGFLFSNRGVWIPWVTRGSIQAVPKGQTEAADALGLSPGQRLRQVTLPQALRIAAPATGNEFLNLTKNVSLGVAVGYAELLRVAQTATGNGQPAPQSLSLVLLGYLTLSIIISLVVNVANRRLQLVER